jgi:hypothetical protein
VVTGSTVAPQAVGAHRDVHREALAALLDHAVLAADPAAAARAVERVFARRKRRQVLALPVDARAAVAMAVGARVAWVGTVPVRADTIAAGEATEAGNRRVARRAWRRDGDAEIVQTARAQGAGRRLAARGAERGDWPAHAEQIRAESALVAVGARVQPEERVRVGDTNRAVGLAAAERSGLGLVAVVSGAAVPREVATPVDLRTQLARTARAREPAATLEIADACLALTPALRASPADGIAQGARYAQWRARLSDRGAAPARVVDAAIEARGPARVCVTALDALTVDACERPETRIALSAGVADVVGMGAVLGASGVGVAIVTDRAGLSAARRRTIDVDDRVVAGVREAVPWSRSDRLDRRRVDANRAVGRGAERVEAAARRDGVELEVASQDALARLVPSAGLTLQEERSNEVAGRAREDASTAGANQLVEQCELVVAATVRSGVDERGRGMRDAACDQARREGELKVNGATVHRRRVADSLARSSPRPTGSRMTARDACLAPALAIRGNHTNRRRTRPPTLRP